MNLFTHFRDRILDLVRAQAEADGYAAALNLPAIVVEPPKNAEFGDITTNAALVMAKPAGAKPRDIATRLAEALAREPAVAAAEVAGPGFINLRLDAAFWQARVGDVLNEGTDFGNSRIGGGAPINVEYVSANPTGPLHVGHGRGAVFGDALAALLEKAGFAVCREYYINDAGQQIAQLAESVYLRYLEALGHNIDGALFSRLFPGREWQYRGDYLKPVAAALAARHGDRFAPKGAGAGEIADGAWREIFRDAACDSMMASIREDLDALGVHHDVFVSERRLHDEGRIQHAVTTLERMGAERGERLVEIDTLPPPKGKLLEDWEPREQLLFRATRFGDDVDRPLQKSDGSWTYFAADIAYHLDKFERGFETLIDVWGADHGGYVKRVQAALAALTGGKAKLDVKICQLVNLLDGGQPVRMSKRAGSFVTLRDVVDEVGRDVVRFIMLTRRNDAPLDFDFAKVTEQSKDNPVFYVQYAHARAHSALRVGQGQFPDLDISAAALANADLGRLTHPAELALIKDMLNWPRVVETAAEAHEPHRVAFYLYDLASSFHALWNLGKDAAELRFVLADDRALTTARLAMTRALALVIASGLKVLGVQPMEEMR